MVLQGVLLSTLFAAAAVATTVAGAAPDVDHGKEQIAWLRTEGGLFHESLEIRRSNDYYAMFTTASIPAKETIIRVPRSLLVDSKGSLEMCDAARNLNALLKKANAGEEVNPYVHYLASQPTGQLPSAWSDQGKALLKNLIGDTLPPWEAVDFDFAKDCGEPSASNDAEAQHAYLIILQRGWDDVLIPLYDMMSHRNGAYLNTESDTVHDPNGDVVVRASRDIQPGEELYTTYNFCVDCGARAVTYGTPDILADYGFIEMYPQRWIFSRHQNLSFELMDEDDLQWLFPNKPDSDAVDFLRRELKRLAAFEASDLTANSGKVPEKEWNVVKQYHSAISNAMAKALGNLEYDQHQCVPGEDGDCGPPEEMPVKEPVKSFSYYDSLEEKPDELAYSLYTCAEGRNMEFPDHQRLDFVQSLYQEIDFYSHPETKDTCFELDSIVQMCGSYRPHYHEWVVHNTAKYIDTVKRVLWVGGGDSMLLHDILKYPTLELVVGLEIDQQVTRLSFKHFGSQPHWDNDKVQWWYGDAAKSMLMLPQEYFGSFDMVLVDLSETVMSISVTDGLDIFGALALLLTPEGIIVKNELYLDKFSDIFKYTTQLHYYDIPVICSQALVYGSYKNDLLHRGRKDHELLSPNLVVHPDEDNFDPYSDWHDYRRNNTGSQKHCMEPGETNEVVIGDEQSPGILMILEAENVGIELSSASELQKTLEKTLEKEGVKVLSTATYDGDDTFTITVVTEDGYVTARAWSEHKYIAFDLHLWNSFNEHDAIKAALLAAVKCPGGKSSSSYRIVAGGVHGIVNREKRGPILTQDCDPVDDTVRDAELAQSSLDTILRESMSLVTDDEITVGVVCGKDKCPSVDALKKMDNVKDVIVIPTCYYLSPTENKDKELNTCEQETFRKLKEDLGNDGKNLRALVVDPSTPFSMLQVVHRMYSFDYVRSEILNDNIIVLAPMADETETWRRVFLERFRHDFIVFEPNFRAEVLFNNSDSSLEMGIISSGDFKFMNRLMGVASRIEEQTGLVSDVRNIQNGLFNYMDGFKASQFFLPKDFDQTDSLTQFTTQQPLGVQNVIQTEVQPTLPEFIVGDRILGNYLREGEWYSGTIMAKLDSGAYHIMFDDGDGEENVAREFIKEMYPSPERKVQTPNVTAEQLKSAFHKALVAAEIDTKVHEFEKVGDGCVLAALWSDGSIVVLSDGRIHVDLNVFSYGEDQRNFSRRFAQLFKAEIPNLGTALHDEQPRGYGRVVNFQKDTGGTPHWVEQSSMDVK